MRLWFYTFQPNRISNGITLKVVFDCRKSEWPIHIRDPSGKSALMIIMYSVSFWHCWSLLTSYRTDDPTIHQALTASIKPGISQGPHNNTGYKTLIRPGHFFNSPKAPYDIAVRLLYRYCSLYIFSTIKKTRVNNFLLSSNWMFSIRNERGVN